MAVSTANATELTTEQVQATLITPLGLASVFLAAGPVIFDTPGRPVRVPSLVSMTAPSWVSENTLIPESDPDFGEVTLLPETMKSLKTLTRYSNEIARQSVISLDAALQARMVKDVGDTLDAQFLGNSGDGVNVPRGLFAYQGTQSVTYTGSVSLDTLHDAQGAALAAGVDVARVRWVMRPETLTALRKQKDGSQRYQITPDPTAASGFVLLGHPVSLSNAVPSGRAALVDFSQIAVARDLAPSVKILDQTYGDYDQQAIRVVARFDAKPLNPQAVVVISAAA